MRYGKIYEEKQSAPDFRVDSTLRSLDRLQLGNGGVNKETLLFMTQYRSELQDMFIDDDSLYVLPASKQFAAMLFSHCIGKRDEYGEHSNAIADEIDWIKIGSRYWLRLWWD